MAKPPEPQQPYDAGDKNQVEQKTAGVKTRDQREDNNFIGMMNTPNFRAFVWDRLVECHVFAQSADVTNVNNTYFREGERNVGLKLTARVLRLCPHQYPIMAAEAAKRAEEQ